ncbi:Copia protein [Araneus ventricosus]|uniref:Copia protein n=1 Tax=Araneus ventricosus TaxID=182803 RepID=A0A4Y1ZNP5_ARAVE|nr:Copia protein [Araneus ventricosus]GBL59419.1 Copia protein [Araneus ventricosus]GBL59454.1 Copia protein [Araneus ventricosus]GBL59465.1 Copia protein [Araneus ventricosus]
MESSIEYLEADNYSSWRTDMKVLLMERNCWRIVTGTETKPEDENYKELRDFNSRKDKAYSTIYLNVSKAYRCVIDDIEDPVAAWKRLEEHFRPNSRARVIGLTDDFFSCRINPQEEMGIYAARIRSIVDQLKDAGKPISEWYQAFQLIRFLPAEFNGIVQYIYRWDDNEFKFDKILQELIAEESRLKQSIKDQNETCAFQSIERNISKTPRSKSKPSSYKKNIQPTRKNTKVMKSPNTFIAESNLNQDYERDAWILDTAATSHFCSKKSLLRNFRPVKNLTMSVAVGGVRCDIKGIGTVRMIFENNAKKLNGQFCVNPRIEVNRNSNGKNVKGNSRFESVNKIKSKIQNFSTFNVNNLRTWHNRMCHINERYIIQTSKNKCVKGLPELKHSDFKCEPCKLAKSRCKSFKPIGKIRSSKPLELLHMDLCGPFPDVAIGGHRYFLSIIDDFSRKVTTYPIKEKTEVFKHFSNYQKRAERFLNSKVINVRTDNGLEFCHAEFQSYLDDLGIKAERTNVYSPQQNGVAERYNYTAVDAIKVMLNSSGLSKGFWAEALLCHTYVWNRVCHSNQSLTPFELYSGHKPSVKHLKAFGSTAYAGVPKQLRKKFDMRAKKGIMVGYALKTRGYRIWLPNERKIVETINVSFDEDNMLEPNSSGAVLDPNKKIINVSSNSEFDTESEEESEHLSIPRTPKTQSSEQEGASNNSKTSEKVIWERKAVPRKDRSRTDIYYIQGSKDRFHCYKDIEEYCKIHNLEYDKALFNFSGKDKYSGIVTMEEANQSD